MLRNYAYFRAIAVCTFDSIFSGKYLANLRICEFCFLQSFDFQSRNLSSSRHETYEEQNQGLTNE